MKYDFSSPTLKRKRHISHSARTHSGSNTNDGACTSTSVTNPLDIHDEDPTHPLASHDEDNQHSPHDSDLQDICDCSQSQDQNSPTSSPLPSLEVYYVCMYAI